MGGNETTEAFEHRRDIKVVFLENEFSDVIRNGLNTRVWKQKDELGGQCNNPKLR